MAGSGHNSEGGGAEGESDRVKETQRERESTTDAWRPVGQVDGVERKRSQHSLLRHKEQRGSDIVLPVVTFCVNSVPYNETIYIYIYLYLCVSVPDILLRVKAPLGLGTETVSRSVLQITLRLNLHTHESCCYCRPSSN